jgi:hypothetical protein
MASTTRSVTRTSHLLALMKKGDDAFNSRDFAAMKAAHHPGMIAHVPGSIEPIHGQPAHAKMIEAMYRIFPDVHVFNDPCPIQFSSGDWTYRNHPRHRDLHWGDDFAQRQSGSRNWKGVRPDLRHDRQVGRRPASRGVRLLGLRFAGAADRSWLVARRSRTRERDNRDRISDKTW